MELLAVKGLKKYFPIKAQKSGGGKSLLRALDGVDFSVAPDSVFSIVGESGCGKSTAARLILRLMEPTAGEVTLKGRNIFTLKGRELKAYRKSVQIIFQDPFASLNPRKTVLEAIAEPIKIHGLAKGNGVVERVEELLLQVGLTDVLRRYPHEFSGGQRQRICIARALAVSPDIIVADEPLSALDVSIQAQILNLLKELKAKTGIAYIFISHDLRVVEYLSDRVGVMYLGKIVELSDSEPLFAAPMHPYTEVLLSSAPKLKPGGQRKAPLAGEISSAVDVPPGCPFHPRCPKKFGPCDKEVPELRSVKGRQVACHLW